MMTDYRYTRSMRAIAAGLVERGAPLEGVQELLAAPPSALPPEHLPQIIRRLAILRQDIVDHSRLRPEERRELLAAVAAREREFKKLRARPHPGLTASIAQVLGPADPKLLQFLQAQDIDIERSKPLSALLMDVRDLLKIVDGHETVADEIREVWQNELARISLNLKRILARTGAGG